MYPQTPEEIKRTNIILAVIYGGLTVLAFGVGYIITMIFFFASMPFMMIDIYEPLAFVAAGDKLYLVEEGLGDFNLFKFPEELSTVIRMQEWDGSKWRQGPEIEELDDVVSAGGKLVGVSDDSLIPFDGMTPEFPVDYDLSMSHAVASYRDGIALLQLGNPGYVKLIIFDTHLNVIEIIQIEAPEEFPSGNGCRSFRLASAGETLFVFWKINGQLLYTEISDQRFGEIQVFPRYVGSYRISKDPDRLIVLSTSPGQPTKPGKDIKVHVTELIGKDWKDLPLLSLPSTASHDFHATFREGDLEVYYSGFSPGWRKLTGSTWLDRREELPGGGRNVFQSMFGGMFKLMLLMVPAMSIFPLLVIIIAHLHFRTKKNPHLSAGGYQVELASLGRRAIAFIIDNLIIHTPIIAPIIIAFSFFDKFFEQPQYFFILFFIWMIAIFGLMFLPIVYFSLLEWLWGVSIGKKIMGLKVIMEDGSKITGLAAFLRNLLRLFDQWFYFLPVIISVAATQKYQRIGDLAGNTIVILEKSMKPAAPEETTPPLPETEK